MFGRARTKAEQKRAEAGYRKDVLEPHPDWQRQFKAAAKNGSVRELRGLARELSAAIDRLESFLKDPERYGT